MRLLLTSTFLIFIFPPISAYAYCYEPSAPSCASTFGGFDDEWEFDRCKREMESYKADVESYIDCNNQQARRKNEDAISEYESAVDSFNRRARN